MSRGKRYTLGADDSKTSGLKFTPRMTTRSAEAATLAAAGSPSLQARVVTRAALDAATVRAMYALYASSYADTAETIFRRDLATKTHVLLLTRDDGALRGFTTIEHYTSNATGRLVRVLFSGDTVVERADWGSPALAVEWLRFAGAAARADATPLYWLLIVKGHRTYRFLPAFAKRYVPHHELAESPDERALLSALARAKFGAHFDAATGVVRFPTPQGRLVDELANVPERHRRLPAVAHFLGLNPGYRAGDELVCLCELALANLRPFAARAFAGALEPAL